MNLNQLEKNIISKRTFLCLGLDTDINKIPKHLLSHEDPVFQFNKSLVDKLFNKIAAVKINTAFYEARGIDGWNSLEKTIKYIRDNYPNLFTIADAKRADIGNTSKMYARAFFNNMNFDAVTIAPYMGKDSVSPFLDYSEKWAIILALTSNEGSLDFQNIKDIHGKEFFKHVLSSAQNWGSDQNSMFVIGATQAEKMLEVRKIVPNHFLLVPGVGAQGGNLQEIAKYGMNAYCGLLVNSSRGIIYASSEKDFAEKAALEAQKLQREMADLLLSI